MTRDQKDLRKSAIFVCGLWLIGVLVSYEGSVLAEITKCIVLILLGWGGICGVSLFVYRRCPTMNRWERAIMVAVVILSVILFFTSVCVSVDSLKGI